MKYEGGSGTTFFLIQAPPGEPPPDAAGIFVVTGTVGQSELAGEALFAKVCIAGQSSHLNKVIDCIHTGFSSVPPLVRWEIAYLEIDEPEWGDLWAFDLQAGMANFKLWAA